MYKLQVLMHRETDDNLGFILCSTEPSARSPGAMAVVMAARGGLVCAARALTFGARGTRYGSARSGVVGVRAPLAPARVAAVPAAALRTASSHGATTAISARLPHPLSSSLHQRRHQRLLSVTTPRAAPSSPDGGGRVPIVPDDDDDDDELNEAVGGSEEQDDDDDDLYDDEEEEEEEDNDEEWDASEMPFLVGSNPEDGGATEVSVDVLLVEENGGVATTDDDGLDAETLAELLTADARKLVRWVLDPPRGSTLPTDVFPSRVRSFCMSSPRPGTRRFASQCYLTQLCARGCTVHKVVSYHRSSLPLNPRRMRPARGKGET